MSERATDTLHFVARQLVDHPDDVRIDVSSDDRGTTLHLMVHPDDVGKVIGRHGRTAKALRTLIRAAGSLDDDNVNVEIED
ncbi:KH domain-containing protein [Salsipaludibacter albus]|uniref:KH domain-containing protein n=1 Tax=Salsipaludibacter albus TaxID=2849650 RepID=UPI001EE3E4D0|nr:KH domain-containing protein [Salsipaludibacter albus]MBY5164064.1 KH domain-containing protein [Salsipaludibacter albus]